MRKYTQPLYSYSLLIVVSMDLLSTHQPQDVHVSFSLPTPVALSKLLLEDDFMKTVNPN